MSRRSPTFSASSVLLCAAAVALLSAAPTGTSASGAASAQAPACATSALVVWLDTRGDAAAGHVFYNLELTNLSSSRCTLRGYPGVSGVDLRGRQLGTPAGRNAHTPSRVVTLAAGGTAAAVLQIANADVFPRTSCRPVLAAGLRVFAPNQRASKLVPFPFRACSHAGPVYLQVQAVRPRG